MRALYQLVGEPDGAADRTFEVVTLQNPGVRAYVFTFG
jgi:hypothetical protein